MARLLIVDSNQWIIEALTDYFTQLPEPHKVTIFPCAETALGAFTGGKPPFDLVIAGENLARINGIALAIAIKKLSPNTPIILISGQDGLSIKDTPKEVDAFFRKPYDIEELGCCVARLLKGVGVPS